MNLFDFGMVHAEPDIWEVIPDIEWEISDYDPSNALIWIYGTCWISTKWPWCNTPDHLIMEGE